MVVVGSPMSGMLLDPSKRIYNKFISKMTSSETSNLFAYLRCKMFKNGLLLKIWGRLLPLTRFIASVE